MTHTRLCPEWAFADRFSQLFERAAACGFIFDADLGTFCRPDEPGQWRDFRELEAEYTSWVSVYGEPCLLNNGWICPDAEWWET